MCLGVGVPSKIYVWWLGCVLRRAWGAVAHASGG